MPAGDILDTHLHLLDRTRLSYPWLGDVRKLDRDWLLSDYAAEARRIGISRAIHMEADVADDRIEDETSYIEDLAASEDFRICGAIAACRPEAPGFSAFLERSLSHSLVVGFRRPLHVVPDGLSETDQFRENIRSLARPDLPFDICVFARQLPLAIALADAAPNTRFVLDHCGVPDIAGGEWEAWAEHIRDLAKRPNISAKISGVIAYAGDNWTLSELSRWVEHVVEAFGVDRICWGGDWPVCTLGGGLSTWVAASRAITAAWSAEERDKLFIRNAEKIWNV